MGWLNPALLPLGSDSQTRSGQGLNRPSRATLARWQSLLSGSQSQELLRKGLLPKLRIVGKMEIISFRKLQLLSQSTALPVWFQV